MKQTVVIAIAVLATLAFVIGAIWLLQEQQPSFTRPQAMEGRKAYRDNCASCHGARLEGLHLAPGLVGKRFDTMWRGKTADALMGHIRRMPPEPQGTPGSLSDEVYTNILAYVLISNGFEPDGTELPASMAGLGAVLLPRSDDLDFDPDAPVVASAEQTTLLNNLQPITDDMLRNPSPDDWLQWGRTYEGHSFSPLDQINKANVKDLKLAWRVPLRKGWNMAAPLVHEGVMYLHTYPDTVLAMDASNGDVLWRYQHKTPESDRKMGLALHGEKVLVPTSDFRLLALNSKTGVVIWDHVVYPRSSSSPVGDSYKLRGAPLVVGNKAILGVTSTFVSTGGFILAVDVHSGEEVWRFNTIPRPGEVGDNSWNGVAFENRSGGSVWHQGTYDAELNLIYYGVAPTYDTGPLLHSSNKKGISNDALFTNCTIAIDPDTGELVWYYQHMANDQWDLDWAFERQIATIHIEGKPRKIVMNSGKMAILDVLDAATGEFLFSVDTGTQNVITAINPETGAKTIDPEKMPDSSRPCVVCPNPIGARNWPPTSFSPETHLVYVPILEKCMLMGRHGDELFTSGVKILEASHPDARDGMLARLQAINVENQALSWTHDQVAPISTGLLTTRGGLLFSGDVEPSLKAFNATSGELLWHAKLDAPPTAGLVTYGIDETQYVAVLVGIPNIHVAVLSRMYRDFVSKTTDAQIDSTEGSASLWVFSL